ncbi:hypothetical protein POTOM_024994 [Populus tomentosa]|uniref:Glycosyl hydrolase family 13 catalytic domain-containing protein n=1 Tax=Populus tomentosa TaxID=118781 RepID=A0A8X7ZEB0_POPTO|nr:hypothetical protein POTOM_024994 [Populus tomentosa]
MTFCVPIKQTHTAYHHQNVPLLGTQDHVLVIISNRSLSPLKLQNMNLVHSPSHSLQLPKFISHFQNAPKFYPPKRVTTSNLETIGSNIFSNSTALIPIKAASEGVDTAVVVVEEEEPKLKKFQVFEGHPAPFGATVRDGGVNFAIFAANAVSATLCLISLSDLPEFILFDGVEDPFRFLIIGLLFTLKFTFLWNRKRSFDPRLLSWFKLFCLVVSCLISFSFEGTSNDYFYGHLLMQNIVTEQIFLDPLTNKTGDVWHVLLKGDLKDMLYGYKFDGNFSPELGLYYDPSKIVLDPYAKSVISRGEFGVLGHDDNRWPQMACMIPTAENKFDWEGDSPLKYPQRDLIIYEMHVRGFTQHASSRTEFPGTYLGVVEKLDHLKDLGVNCIELMPCHEFNELEYYSYNSVLGDYKVNFWGYSTVNYFSPMTRYSSAGTRNCGQDAINEFKLLVREAHKRGIEVFMDVVFNHTAEGNEKGPILSFRGVDNSIYYMLAPKGEFYNYSGCGNTFNCNHPIVRQFILECLR